MVAMRFCWAVLGAPTRNRLGPVMAELVPNLRLHKELDELAAALVATSPGTSVAGAQDRSSAKRC